MTATILQFPVSPSTQTLAVSPPTQASPSYCILEKGYCIFDPEDPTMLLRVPEDTPGAHPRWRFRGRKHQDGKAYGNYDDAVKAAEARGLIVNESPVDISTLPLGRVITKVEIYDGEDEVEDRYRYSEGDILFHLEGDICLHFSAESQCWDHSYFPQSDIDWPPDLVGAVITKVEIIPTQSEWGSPDQNGFDYVYGINVHTTKGTFHARMANDGGESGYYSGKLNVEYWYKGQLIHVGYNTGMLELCSTDELFIPSPPSHDVEPPNAP